MPKCSVDGCEREAAFEVILYDFYASVSRAEVFSEQDFTCPYICEARATENENGAQGERKPRGVVQYPYTNRHQAQGFTIYSPIKS